MSCTKRFLFLTWHQHDWRRNVSWAETYPSHETDMWGRGTTGEYVTCQTQYFCTECGKTKAEGFCGCDKARAEQCAIHRTWAAGAAEAASTRALETGR